MQKIWKNKKNHYKREVANKGEKNKGNRWKTSKKMKEIIKKIQE